MHCTPSHMGQTSSWKRKITLKKLCFWKQQCNFTYEAIALVTTCTRSVPVWARWNSIRDRAGGHRIWPADKEQVTVDCFRRRVNILQWYGWSWLSLSHSRECPPSRVSQSKERPPCKMDKTNLLGGFLKRRRKSGILTWGL